MGQAEFEVHLEFSPCAVSLEDGIKLKSSREYEGVDLGVGRTQVIKVEASNAVSRVTLWSEKDQRALKTFNM